MPYSVMTGWSGGDVTGRGSVCNAEGLAGEEVNASRDGCVKYHTL